jgi:hypothetical protein
MVFTTTNYDFLKSIIFSNFVISIKNKFYEPYEKLIKKCTKDTNIIFFRKTKNNIKCIVCNNYYNKSTYIIKEKNMRKETHLHNTRSRGRKYICHMRIEHFILWTRFMSPKFIFYIFDLH